MKISRKTEEPEYQQWKQMRQRCNNPNNKSFSRYGGRGIEVSDSWESYDNFIHDMGRKPSSKHTIDRIDNDKGYSPDNCRWATQKEQQNNRRNNIYVKIGDTRKTLTQWCNEYDLDSVYVLNRSYRLGISQERSLLDAIR